MCIIFWHNTESTGTYRGEGWWSGCMLDPSRLAAVWGFTVQVLGVAPGKLAESDLRLAFWKGGS